MLVAGLYQCILLCHIMFEFLYQCKNVGFFNDKALKGFLNMKGTFDVWSLGL